MKNKLILIFLYLCFSNNITGQDLNKSNNELIHIDSLYQNKTILLLKSIKFELGDTISNIEVKERLKNWLGRNINEPNSAIINETNTQLVFKINCQGTIVKIINTIEKNSVFIELYDLGFVGTDYTYLFFFTKDKGIHTIKRFNGDMVVMNEYYISLVKTLKTEILKR
jgi:hypothetical protein